MARIIITMHLTLPFGAKKKGGNSNKYCSLEEATSAVGYSLPQNASAAGELLVAAGLACYGGCPLNVVALPMGIHAIGRGLESLNMDKARKMLMEYPNNARESFNEIIKRAEPGILNTLGSLMEVGLGVVIAAKDTAYGLSDAAGLLLGGELVIDGAYGVYQSIGAHKLVDNIRQLSPYKSNGLL
ncbi:MAG: hypothetical protein JW727_04165 [Candidatus Aenigmarchaeota archaeon]|nr:hypothetical protein [Candidatus Aenigmarchaeota archaeon]